MKLLFATRSEGKQREARTILTAAGHDVLFPDDSGIRERPEEAALEGSDTFAGNAIRKAEYFSRRSGLPTVADDSGLEVLSLGGEPGVRSKRWAGVDGTPAEVDAANNQQLVRRLAGAPDRRRVARYRCVLAFVPSPGAIPELFEGACSGRILAEPRGSGGFGYDPYFWSDDLEKTFAEASADEKNTVSHRARALAALVGRLASP